MVMVSLVTNIHSSNSRGLLLTIINPKAKYGIQSETVLM
jgi:hypothetical protein